MSVVGQEFWIVAVGCSASEQAKAKDEKNKYLSELIAKVGDKSACNFPVPDGGETLQSESFDSYIRLTDDLAKIDSQVESAVHRLERNWLDLDTKADFVIQTKPSARPFKDYLNNWTWDKARYPLSRNVTDQAQMLSQNVNMSDEQARKKMSEYNDAKATQNNLAKKDNVAMLSRDLVDVLVPSVVKSTDGKSPNDDFISTEHLTTVVVILARGQEKEFLPAYESLQAPGDSYDKMVVPGSAKKFNIPDKEGHTVYRVVMTRANVDDFKKQCRERKFAARDFEFSKDGHEKLEQQRKDITIEVKQKHEESKRAIAAAWSDVMVSWVHIKAMRTYVESVLRCGGGPSLYLASFLLCPAKAKKARQALEDFARGKRGTTSSITQATSKDAEEDEEIFPYVSLSFTPFTVPRDGK